MPHSEWQARHGLELDQSRIGTVSRAGDGDVVVVVVNAELYPDISAELAQFSSDLVTAGYSVQLDTMRGMGHVALRSHLAGVADIAGAVLVGELPVAWYEIDCEEFPADIFFMDLNGVWSDGDGDGIYDSHTGNVGLEIWVGRLYARGLTWDDEVRLARRYFAKNHAYRNGGLGLPDRALAYVDDDWYGFGNCDLDELYPDVVTVVNRSTTRASDYRQRLEQGYEWIQVCSHSSPWGHTFLDNWQYVGTVFNTEIYAIRPHAHFYNLFCCSGTRYVEENYSAGWDVFQDDYGLLAVGSSKTGAMMQWFDDFYRPMGSGSCIGDAFRAWFAEHGEYSRFWHYGLNLLGDPSLKPRQGTLEPGGHELPGALPPADAEAVGPDPETDDSPRLLALPDGRVWAIWKSGRSTTNGRFDIYAAVRDQGVWSSAYNIGPDEYWDTDPCLGIDGQGRPVAVWACFTHDYYYNLYYSVWNGTSWSGKQRVSDDNSADLQPVLCRDSSGTLWCLWSSRRDYAGDIFASGYNGSSWSSPVNVTADSDDELHPDAAATAGNRVWVAYTKLRDGRAEVWAAYRNGGVWTETGPVSGTQARALRPGIAAGPDSEPVVCWQSFDSGNGDIWYSEYDGADWSAPAQVDADTGLDVLPRMTTDAEGKPWVVWMSQRNGNWDVFCSYRNGAGWTQAQAVETGPGPDMNPDVSAGPGEVWVLWQNLSAGNWEVLATQLPMSGQAAGEESRPGLVRAWPNPFRDRLRIAGREGEKLMILDASGRVVRRLRSGPNSSWDGRDAQGRALESGVFFVQPEAGRAERVLLVR